MAHRLTKGAKALRLIKVQHAKVKAGLKNVKQTVRKNDKDARKLSKMIDALPQQTKELYNEYLTTVVEMLDAKFIL